MAKGVNSVDQKWVASPASTGRVPEQSNLTQSQYLIWTGQKLEPDVPLYNMVLCFKIQGPLQYCHFQSAFQTLLDRSEPLRSVIEEVDGVPRQRVRDPFNFALPFVDLSATSAPQAELRSWIRRQCVVHFDFNDLLFDTALLKVGHKNFVWYFNQHHVMTDAWSTSVIYQRMAELYQHSVNNTLDKAPSWPCFQIYVEHEKKSSNGTLGQKATEYWSKQLRLLPEPAQLYGRRAQPNSARTERVRCDLGLERSQALRQLAAEKEFRSLTLHLSLFNVFCTVLLAFLHRVSGERSLVVGTPAHNRTTPAFKETIGLFIEIFPILAELDKNENFRSLFKKVANASGNFFKYALPGVSRSAANRSFNVLLNYIHASFPDFCGMPMESEWIHAGYGDRRHHLRLQVHDFDESGQFLLYFDIHADLFDAKARTAMTFHFLRLLDAFIEDASQPIDEVPLLSKEETQRLVVDFNQSQTDGPPYPSIVPLFEEQVSRTPDDIALFCTGSHMTYRELNHKANQLANLLRQSKVGPESCVGIALKRSPEMILAILGTLKAGGAYVPIDPSLPTRRIAFLLEDTCPIVILASHEIADRLPPTKSKLFYLDRDQASLEGEPGDNLDSRPSKKDLAYVLYTSGSTGTPKGVAVEHRGLAEYVWWAQQHYVKDGQLDFPLFTSLSFDLTVTSIFVPLVSGGRVVIYPEDDAPDLTVLSVVADNAVDIMKLTPAHLALLSETDLKQCKIQRLILGGENLTTNLAKKITIAWGGSLEIYNEYGPTEAIVGCMSHRYDPAVDRATSVPIGKPANHAEILLLDKKMNPVPEGILGEIYIAGRALARGYINQPEVTAQRFVPHPFKAGERMYRTGDMARFDTHGNIVYARRLDQQVNLRGVRIELGEIEAALLSREDIDHCVLQVIEYEEQPDRNELAYCARCGLASNYPGTRFDDKGVCNKCQAYDKYKGNVQRYFRNMDDLHKLFADAKDSGQNDYDCMMLMSGGKDSTYALYQLVEMGLKVFVFSLDNGYISEDAKANIRRVVEALNLDHVFATTPAMNAIFRDSLKRFSNVCNGCFKVIYTLSMNLAREKGIHTIVTGLSRGQLFETRLTEELFQEDAFDVTTIDQTILEARKAYHRLDDEVSRRLDVTAFKDDQIFEEIRFVDFYRYCDVGLEEMYNFLDEHAPWIRPSDTGRSTNCLINDVGIYVHKRERRFHNYALPYSWDVRMGHKVRESALEELDDRINVASVQRILHEIGYDKDFDVQGKSQKHLAAYVVSANPIATSDLKDYLAERLPKIMIPSTFVHLDRIPLTPHGKTDLRALPIPKDGPVSRSAEYVAPTNQIERQLAKIWGDVLRLRQVGIHDNFFDLGGDSIMSIQIIVRANEKGLRLMPNQLFQHQTVAELATVVDASSSVQAEQGRVSGPMPATPIQRWFFEKHIPEMDHWNQVVLLDIPKELESKLLKKALSYLLDHHDALRLQFTRQGNEWIPCVLDSIPSQELDNVDLRDCTEMEAVRRLATKEAELNSRMSIREGVLLQAAHVRTASVDTNQLLMVVHHLAVDGVSWLILLEDLHTICEQLQRGEPVRLPPKTTSFKEWAERIFDYARSEALQSEVAFWLAENTETNMAMGKIVQDGTSNTEGSAKTISVPLSQMETSTLLQDVPSAYHTQINDVLLAALVLSFTKRTGSRSLRLDLEGHGREDIVDGLDVSRTVGWFTTHYPVTLFVDDPSNIGACLKSIKEQLRTIPNRGIGFGLLRALRKDSELEDHFRGIPASPLLFNYLGKLDQLLPQSCRFRFARELTVSYCPGATRSHCVEINTFVVGGRLKMDWRYSADQLSATSVWEMAEDYAKALRTVITHCVSRDEVEFTPADFPLADLDQQKFQKLARLLDKTDGSETTDP